MLLYHRKIKKAVCVQYITKGKLRKEVRRRYIYPPTANYHDNYIMVNHHRKMVYLDPMDKMLHCLVIQL